MHTTTMNEKEAFSLKVYVGGTGESVFWRNWGEKWKEEMI